jgi:hypothetical protein
MEIANENITLENAVNHRTGGLGTKAVYRLAGNRIFRIDPLPRGKMADVPLQKSKNGLTSVDVLNYLREEVGRGSKC